ncbi:MAG: carbohydrate kinase family protein [Arenimonas sp.]|nr:carbohydrate kinase family protein [Arenimonas sp.]
MTHALICGSLAFDTIMVFQDQFKNHILPDKVHILNVSFFVPRMRKEFGGCAGNIAYNLMLLGGKPLPMATVGQDFESYREHFEQCNIPLTHVKVIPELYTAQAFITTDLDDNQITAFHPGAMMRSYENHVKDVSNVGFGIVGPDSYEAMLQNCQEFYECGIPFIFDPGQAMPLYNGHELKQMIHQATYVTVNEYEADLLSNKTGLSTQEIAAQVEAYIITRGDKGSEIHTNSGILSIPAANAIRVVDPTGCGDAYRAGLIFGLMNKMDLATSGRIASLMGALKIEHLGPQNQRFSYAQFALQFKQQFGYALS